MIVKILDKKVPDTMVVPLAQDAQLADRLAEIAARTGADAATLQNDFRAEAKEVFVLYAAGSPGRRLYLCGIGKKTGFQEIFSTLRLFCHRYKSKLPQKVGFDLRHFPPEALARYTEAATSGALLGLYDIGKYRTETKPEAEFGGPKSEINIVLPTKGLKEMEAPARRGQIFALTYLSLFDLLNAPGNYKTPEQMANWAVKTGKEYGFFVNILNKSALHEQGLKALTAVGQGSPNPPALIVLEYGAKTRKTKTPVFGLVGKGVTFDTGGVSLKPSTNMHLMKSDMGGAAAVLGAFMVAARLQLPVRMIGVIPAAENMIDGLAIKPGDVIGSLSGKTIEVIDTDAEGRLILADGLAYLLKQEMPDVLIDLATLTGSIIRAIGTQAGGLFTKSDQLADLLSAAGMECGERLWRMPMWDDYGSDLKSDVADLRNFTGKPMAESISAAKFLEHFTSEHPHWAHLDIAGMAFADSDFATSKSATGYGVRLLIEFIEKWSNTTETPS